MEALPAEPTLSPKEELLTWSPEEFMEESEKVCVHLSSQSSTAYEVDPGSQVL